jgi:predicted RNA-binding protein YlqC (UPF0109 family)
VSAIRDAIEVLVRALADDPDGITVTESEHRGRTLVELFVGPGDVGKMIGRQGRTVQALRTLAATAGEKDGKSVTLEIRESKS